MDSDGARGNRDNDIDAELEFHFAEAVDALVEHGLTERAARAEVERRFGDRQKYQLDLRSFGRMQKQKQGRHVMDDATSRWPNVSLVVDSIVRDVYFSCRLLRKNATVTVVAVVSLSLAIGACTASFSLIDALILRPLPVRDPEQLINVVYRSPGDADDSPWFNYPLFERMRSASREHVQLFGMSFPSRRDAIFDDGDRQHEKVYAQWISGDALAILGVKPALGRLLTTSDDVKPGQHPVAMISYDFWLRRFGGSPSALGRWVTIREKQLQIVGVVEQGFTGVEPGLMTDLWAPNMMWDEKAISEPGWSWFRVWGRLQPDARPEQARAVLQTVSANFRRERAATRPADEPQDQVERYINTPLHLRSAANGPSALRHDFARALLILGVIAALVLLIACSNVASLLTARTAARSREMALRVSIGAGRARLIQQILIESAIIAFASCVVGALLAMYAAPSVVSLLSTSVSVIRLDLGLDWRVLAFVGGTGALVTFLFGLAPALRASTAQPSEALKSGSAKQTARTGVFRPLVAAQTAFSFMVLFVSGLFLASFSRLVNTDLGFDRNNLVIASIEARDLREGGPKALAVWKQLLERVSGLPGIESAGLSSWSLFDGSTSSRSIRIPGRPVEAFEPFYLPVSPGFLETMHGRRICRIPIHHRALVSSTAERHQERGTSTDVRACRCGAVGADPGVARNTRRSDDYAPK